MVIAVLCITFTKIVDLSTNQPHSHGHVADTQPPHSDGLSPILSQPGADIVAYPELTWP
jgi:hypothetical protein